MTRRQYEYALVIRQVADEIWRRAHIARFDAALTAWRRLTRTH